LKEFLSKKSSPALNFFRGHGCCIDSCIVEALENEEFPSFDMVGVPTDLVLLGSGLFSGLGKISELVR